MTQVGGGAGAAHRDWWPAGLFVLHLGHAWLFAWHYPHYLEDADLLAYFTFFRNWLRGSTALHGLPYFTAPKPLLVFTLGPLADSTAAFCCTAVVSALLGSVCYLVARQAFGRTAGVLLSVALLLDPSKAVLTLRSGADLYLALGLFATIYLSTLGRPALSSTCLFLSALVKPVTLPCVLHFLVTQDRLRRRWIWALIPLLALPLSLLANQALVGDAMAPARFLAAFEAFRHGTAIGPGEVLHFTIWTQMVKTRFVSTAVWGFLGLLLWLTADRKRLTSPLFLVPVLFLSGYVMVSAVSPFVPFFRYFWTLEIWFLAFLIFGILEVARRIASGTRWLTIAVACVPLFFLMDTYLTRQVSYRRQFALAFEESMAFVTDAREVLVNERRTGERILSPLAYLPYLLWELKIDGGTDVVLTAEQAVVRESAPRSDWVLYVPKSYTNRAAEELVARLIRQGGYEVRLTDGTRALLRRTQRR